MSLQLLPAAVNMSALEKQIADVAAAAKAADDKAANARQMVLTRDPVLNDLKATAALFGSTTAGADAIHAELARRIDEVQTTPGPVGPAGVAGAQGLRGPSGTDGVQGMTGSAGAVGATGLAGKDGKDSTTAGPAGAVGPAGSPGAAGTPADMSRVAALETAVTALQQLKVTVGFGVANLPGSLAAGATTNVVVPLSRDMGSATYSVGYGLAGGTSLLGSLQATGVVSQTKTSVTIAVKNAGLTALLNLSTASLSVVAARDA